MDAAQWEKDYRENLASIDEKFEVMKDMVSLVAEGGSYGLLIDGAPGIGKSHTIATHLKEKHIKDAAVPVIPAWYSGHITPLMTFHALGDNKAKNCLVVFDDCDGVFQEVNSMNVLKAATEMRSDRIVSWNSAFKGAKYDSYRFDAGLIIISNANFKSVHFQALTDRMHVLSMQVTPTEKLAKIFSVATQNDVCDSKTGFEIAMWLYEEKENIDYMSIRTFMKISQLVQHRPGTWRKLAQMTILDPLKQVSKQSINHVGKKV